MKGMWFSHVAGCLLLGGVHSATGAGPLLDWGLTASAVAGAPGAEVLFSGGLTNSSVTQRVFLNQVVAAFEGSEAASSGLEMASNEFFANVPGILEPGEVYVGPLFRLRLGDRAIASNYVATVSLLGGTTQIAEEVVGTVRSTVLATPAEQWRYRFFGDAAALPLAADLADWDGDGAPNLLEYALGLNPRVSDTPTVLGPVLNADHLSLGFVPVAPDILYRVQSSTNLTDWSSQDVEPVDDPSPVPPGREIFRYRLPVSSTERAFLRLQVSRLGLAQ